MIKAMWIESSEREGDYESETRREQGIARLVECVKYDDEQQRKTSDDSEILRL